MPLSFMTTPRRKNKLAAIKCLFLRPLASSPTLTGPVLVVGSGPGGALPAGMDHNWTVATVNGSQVVGEGLGLGVPDLTLMGAAVMKDKPVNLEAQHVLSGRHTKLLISPIGRRRYSAARWRLMRIDYTYDAVFRISTRDKIDIVNSVLGDTIQHKHKPSNGVILALACLHWGASSVVMTGFSLTKHGHAYNDAERPREHIDEDRIVLAKAVSNGAPLFTTSQDFAAESGLPIFGANSFT